MKIRIKFEKTGVMKFIGHLDVMRYFQKAIRRADIDIAYSEGFSPHQIMSFAAPLGVGLTSSGEYLDIEVHSTQSSKESIARFNKVSAEGITVKSYRKLADSAKNAMSIVAAADYTLTFREGLAPEGWQDKLKAFYEQPSILITKKTKKSEREIDLKPLIYHLSVEEQQAEESGMFCLADGQNTDNRKSVIHMRLCTGSVDNIKPELVMEAFYQSFGLSMPEFALLIHRGEIYADLTAASGQSDRTDAQHLFVALEDLGEDIEY